MIYVGESPPDEIKRRLEAHANKDAARMWLTLTTDAGATCLVNSARLASMRAGPRGMRSSLVTFMAGFQMYVGESSEAIIQMIEKRS